MRDRARRAGLDVGGVYYRKDQEDWVFGETKTSSRKEANGNYSVDVTSTIHSEGRYFGGIGRRIKDFLSDWNPIKSVEAYVGTVVKKEVSIERAGLPVKFVVPLFGGQIKWRSDKKEPEYKLVNFTSGYVNGKFAGMDFRIMPLEGALGGDYTPGYRALYPIAKGPILIPVGEMTVPVGEWKIQADASTNMRDVFIGARGVAETGGDGVPILGIPKTGVKVEVNAGYRFQLKWPNIVTEYLNED